ncbi:MAG: MerR family DNA-binding protein [Hyphomicrobiales bacterium]|nr:MerR family DNA-binding protein [Hyphomicrobiales bacterium]
MPTIRYYEQTGLIDAPERTAGNQRRYCRSGLERLSFIRHGREPGLSIEDIRELVILNNHPEKPCDDTHQIARRHLLSVQERITRLKRLEKELQRIVAEHLFLLTAIRDCARPPQGRRTGAGRFSLLDCMIKLKVFCYSCGL